MLLCTAGRIFWDTISSITMASMMHLLTKPRIIWQFLDEKNIAVLEQAPYSPDLAPIHLFSFPQTQGRHKRSLEGVKAIKRAITVELMGIPEESLHQCTEAWQRKMRKCIIFKGFTLKGKPCGLLSGIEITCDTSLVTFQIHLFNETH